MTTAVVSRRAYFAEQGWAELYGGADGRTVIISLLPGSDGGPYVGNDGGAAMLLSGSRRSVQRFGGRWWVMWAPFSDGEEQAQAAVGAEGFTKQETLEMSRDLVVDRGRRRVRLGHLRYGLHRLTAGRMAVPGIAQFCDDGGVGTAARVGWDTARSAASLSRGSRYATSPRICLGAWKANSGLDNLLRATVSGRRDRRIRGNPGASGTFGVPVFGLDQTVRIRTWREGAATMVVTSVGLRDTALDRFVASLQPSGETDWRRREAEAASPRIGANNAHQIALSGQFDGGTWTVTVADRTVHGEPRVFIGRHLREYANSGSNHGVATASTDLRVGMTAGDRGTLLWGVCDPTISRVVLTLSDGSSVSPPLIHGAAFGANVFALWQPDHRSVSRAVAYGSDHRAVWQGEPSPKAPRSLKAGTDLGFIGQPA